MNILYLGDVVGRCGRQAVVAAVPRLRREFALDLVIVNGENAAHGFGITTKICAEFREAGIDVITTGNHVWDQREIIGYIDGDARLLRPANYPKGTPGRGAVEARLPDGRKVLVVQVMGRLFIEALDDPFQVMETVLASHRLGATAAAIVVDIHAEATSEKMSFGHVFDGRVSAVLGSHSHVPTADAQVLPHGTAYISDAGMCGDYDSVIGMEKTTAAARFIRKLPGERLTPAEGEATVCGVLVTTDDRTGLAVRIAPVRVGGRLAEAMPSV